MIIKIASPTADSPNYYYVVISIYFLTAFLFIGYKRTIIILIYTDPLPRTEFLISIYFDPFLLSGS